MPDALLVSDLTVRFGSKTVFSGVTFNVPAGSAVAIIGPNGAGKTVLLRALLGLIPCRGRVQWADATRVGYVPQKLDLERDIPITGRDFLAARLAVGGLPASRVDEVLTTVGLTSAHARTPIGELSGGQFQRLLLAFALCGEPNVLLLDEPTASIDEPGHARLTDLIAQLQSDRGMTVILISHDLSVVSRRASLVLCLGRQRPLFGPPREILTPGRLAEAYGEPVAFHVHEGGAEERR
jgi:zinc transport system ATP-binding protein